MANRAAVIFDFDGTLTKPYLDFDKIRAEIGIKSGPILEAVAEMEPEARARADRILEKHEWEAARNAVCQPGAREVLDVCRSLHMPVAILTRNARATLEHVLADHDLRVDAIRTREDGPIKPSPEPIRSLCDELEADVAKSWMIGDHLYDVRTGKAAGTRTVLFVNDGNDPEDTGGADYVIQRLDELPPLLGA